MLRLYEIKLKKINCFEYSISGVLMINLASFRYSYKLISVDKTEYWHYQFDKLYNCMNLDENELKV